MAEKWCHVCRAAFAWSGFKTCPTCAGELHSSPLPPNRCATCARPLLSASKVLDEIAKLRERAKTGDLASRLGTRVFRLAPHHRRLLRGVAVSANYVVSVFDRCGEFDSHACGDDLDAAIARYVEWTAHYKGLVVELVNIDCVDLGWPDGLTEDERERVYTAVAS